MSVSPNSYDARTQFEAAASARPTKQSVVHYFTGLITNFFADEPERAHETFKEMFLLLKHPALNFTARDKAEIIFQLSKKLLPNCYQHQGHAYRIHQFVKDHIAFWDMDDFIHSKPIPRDIAYVALAFRKLGLAITNDQANALQNAFFARGNIPNHIDMGTFLVVAGSNEWQISEDFLNKYIGCFLKSSPDSRAIANAALGLHLLDKADYLPFRPEQFVLDLLRYADKLHHQQEIFERDLDQINSLRESRLNVLWRPELNTKAYPPPTPDAAA